MLHARKLSLAVLALAALAASGCGSDDSGGGGGGGDGEAQIRDVVTGYASAVADGDGDKACGYLSQAARDRIEQAADTVDASGCPGVIEKVTDTASADDRDKLGALEVTSVTVSGDTATAQTHVEGDKTDPAKLVKEDGAWKIDIDTGGASATATVSTPQATGP